MRKLLSWCEEKGIDPHGETVGSLYVSLNAHSLDGMRWLCTNLQRCGLDRLPSVGVIDRAIKKRDPALLYSLPDEPKPPTRRPRT